MSSIRSVSGDATARAYGWNTLTELHAVAIAAGYSEAKFADACAAVADNPSLVRESRRPRALKSRSA